MSQYLINYDLMNPGRDYSSLIATIKGYGSWAKICDSCWAISTNSTCVDIRDHLKKYIDPNDRLFVCAFGNWASYNLPKDVADWLNG